MSVPTVPQVVPLATLEVGQKATVSRLLLTGPERRRLLDLGLSPGTVVEARLRSPLGDPIAYIVRGTVIALRREQAEAIEVEPCKS